MAKFITRLKHPWFWRDLWWNIRDFFWPRTKFVLKAIGKSYKENDTIIEHTLAACIINFVEYEEGLDGIWCEEYYLPELEKGHISMESYQEQKACREELEEAYKFFKFELPELEKKLENSYPKRIDVSDGECIVDASFVKNEDGHTILKSCEEMYGAPYEQAYAEHNRLESLIESGTTWALKKIVEHRAAMWT